MLTRRAIILCSLRLTFACLYAVLSGLTLAFEANIGRQQLPIEAQKTLTLIEQGGPFPYRRDGAVFHNREQRLPLRAKGYYREYTVPTPGANDRGARRIVCGGENPTQPDACYYTADHYRSFRRIEP